MEEQIYILLAAIIKTFPIQAEEGCSMPYAIYSSGRLKEYKSLSTFTGLYDQSFEVDIIAATAKSVTTYFNTIRTAVKALEGTTDTYYIQEVVVEENAPMLSEPDIQGYRKILSFAISYQI